MTSRQAAPARALSPAASQPRPLQYRAAARRRPRRHAQPLRARRRVVREWLARDHVPPGSIGSRLVP
ncbi:MAG TPA: hypothetical protein VH539_09535, partial [Gemmatimonadaceae bacterium]